MKEKCKWCKWPEDAWFGCRSQSGADGTGFMCSRHEGHSGPHVACGVENEHGLMYWDEGHEEIILNEQQKVDYTDGRWIATTTGQFIQILVDSGHDPCVIFCVEEDTYPDGEDSAFIRRMTVYSVPNGHVVDMLRELGIVDSDRYVVYKTLKAFIEGGVIT